MAGQRLASDTAIGQLAPFSVAADEPTTRDRPTAPVAWDRGEPVYAGPGWVGGRLRQVESRRAGDGYLLRIQGTGDFAVSADGARIRARRPLAGPEPGEDVAAAVLGPCLALALALRGVWCLHASAAGPRGSAVALTGESGSGKSTLASALVAGDPDWRRIGDDLLPVDAAGGSARALPRFPQPNLAAHLQWRPPAPESVPLAAVYVLEPAGEVVAVSLLSRREAALALVRQTVAARLFDGELQARHLGFCVELARRLPVRRVRFPRRPAALPAMIAAILAGLNG